MQPSDRPRAGTPDASPLSPSGSESREPMFQGAPVEIRPLRTAADFRACIRLQLETWGELYSERVPASILKVSQRIGGIAAGAFDSEGNMLGFVFGISGIEPVGDGSLRPVHWSDMLAVRRDARDGGVGRRLKEYQWEMLRAMGIERMYWTFDPLVARNAHLNVTKLRVCVVEYVVNMYEATTEEDQLFGTDRFVVSWQVAEEKASGAAVSASPLDATVLGDMPIANGAPDARDGAHGKDAIERARLVRIEIPLDIAGIKEAAPEVAARWRYSTRDAFTRLLGRNYAVIGFVRDESAGSGYYVLSR
jgi:chorismate synthase